MIFIFRNRKTHFKIRIETEGALNSQNSLKKEKPDSQFQNLLQSHHNKNSVVLT